MKTIELTGAALDWAVVKCEGYFEIDMAEIRNGVLRVHYFDKCSPTTDWALGGPIIEREGIDIRRRNDQWVAEWWPDNSGMAKKPSQRFTHNRFMSGPTPLIAAMRCYVASKLGDEVQIPEELV